MAISRREFLQGAAIAGASLVLPFKWNARRVYAFSQSPLITKFNTALPGLGAGGIPLATKNPVGPVTVNGVTVDAYNLGAAEFSQQIPGLPNPTHFWGYYDIANGLGKQRYLGGVIVATRGTPVLLTVTNGLPNHQLIPIDPTIMAGPNGLMVGDLPLNRIVTHLHGGFTPWISDGTPFQWYDPTGLTGVSFNNVPGTNPGNGTATYYYTMAQSARLVWYHDHAIGITRTNAYSGIASALVITDVFEQYLVSHNLIPGLPLPDLSWVGIPLIVQDKTFFDPAKDLNYPVSSANGGYAKAGDLWYPYLYESNQGAAPACSGDPTGRWDYGFCMTPPSSPFLALPTPTSAVPEFFADTALINGAPYPTLNVTEGTFRFRFLNASQARFWHLNLYVEDPSNPGEVPITGFDAAGGKPILSATPGPKMYQIATEGGFLPAVAVHPNGIPCPLNLVADPTGNTARPDGPFNLLLAPAERADVLIDFTGFGGQKLILYSDAPGPFPGGDPRNDYYTGYPDFTSAGPSGTNPYPMSGGALTTQQGQGPNTRTIMKFVVSSGSNAFGPLTPAKLTALKTALKQNFTGGNPVATQQDPLLYHGIDTASLGALPYTGNVDRSLTLNEDFDAYGRLIQMEGTFQQNGTNNQGQPTWSRAYLDAPTETPTVGSTEVWQIMNLTADTHPIHFHLVNVQLIQRQPFTGDPSNFTYTGPPTPPDLNEMGWKETVRMNPGEVTTVIMKFDLPQVPFTMPFSTRSGLPPKANEYVWHCHILEHEEHDMMRPLVVVGPNPLAVFPTSQDAAKKSTATFSIYNGTPPYTITVADKQDAKKFPPVPATVSSSGGTFTVDLKKGTAPNADVTYTVKDSASPAVVVVATLTITKK